MKSEPDKKTNKEGIHTFNIDGNITGNHQVISNSFNNNFLSKVEKISNNIYNNNFTDSKNSNPLDYLLKIFNNPFPNTKFNYTSKKEI